MKSIREKQLLVKWARAMNEPLDAAMVEEVERYEQIQKDIIESIRINIINDLQEASEVADNFVKKINNEYPKPPTLDEVLAVFNDETNEIIISQLAEEPSVKENETSLTPSIQEKEISSIPPSITDRVAEQITKEIKLVSKPEIEKQTDIPFSKSLNDIKKKIKFLEDRITKLLTIGSGSGEVKLLKLDDVDTTNLGDNKAIFYNAANAKLEFRTINNQNQGNIGAQGAQGAQGSQGSQGHQGIQGLQGVQGATGSEIFGIIFAIALG
jgi:hypothetical protein